MSETINYLGMDIPLDDSAVWDYLSKGENLKGLFQLETRSASIVLKKIKPKNIGDLSICNALNRPGSSQFLQDMADIRNGEKQAEYDHPVLKNILEDTSGKWIYQESVIATAKLLASFSPKESANLLKAISKKDKTKMAKAKNDFISGMIKNGHKKEESEFIFGKMESFVNYSFNKCNFENETVEEKKEGKIALKDAKVGYLIKAYDTKNKKIHYVKVKSVWKNKVPVFEVKLSSRREIRCSLDHQWLCEDGVMRQLKDILLQKLKILAEV